MKALFFLAIVIHAALALPGDLGYMLGVQEKCIDFYCQEGHISIWNYTLPPPATQKGVELIQVTPDYPYETIQVLGRYNAYDTSKNIYYLLTDIGDEPDYEDTLYTVNLNSLNVTSVILPAKAQISSIEFDSIYGIMYGVFGTNMTKINVLNGTITNMGPLSFNDFVEPSLITCFDVSTGTYFIYVSDNTLGTVNILSYYTRNNSFYQSPAISSSDMSRPIITGMDYYPAKKMIVAVVYETNKWPSVQLIDPRTGVCTDVVSEFYWKTDYGNYDLWPVSDVTNQINVFDPVNNIFWVTTMEFDVVSLAYDDSLLYYNFTKGGPVFYTGAEVIYTNAIVFTNYVWFPWPKP